jgi:CubicO group peptidase (beta-lactamase class C family)
MKSFFCFLTILLSLASPLAAQLPTSTAKEQGLSQDAVQKLDDLVQSLVDKEDVVGAELLVIKNGHSILHESYGWRNREAEQPMENGSVFCVRSMTKPLIGTSILMLMEDGLLKLEDPVSKYIPAFDSEAGKTITMEHLLRHTSGLPMSLIMNTPLDQLGSIHTVAALGAEYELDFTPGSRFQYSDQGTDTLTAVIEIVTGKPAADFVEQRILKPLGMQDSATYLNEDHPLRVRSGAKYAGSRGNWNAFWDPSKPSLFPFFLGSQGLYSTLDDYAKFMDMWLQKGLIGETPLLTPDSIRYALTATPYPLGSPTGLPKARTDYGALMQIWTAASSDGQDGQRQVAAFGHTGSDGTHAWVFPEHNAMVLYFTQSRGTMSGLQIEEALGELFFGVATAVQQSAPPLEQFLGYYWEHDDDNYRAVVLDGDELALEVPGKAILPLTYIGDDRWKVPEQGYVLAFERAENGEVSGYNMGDDHEIRFTPSADLPTIEHLADLHMKAHRLDLLETLGPLRINSKLELPNLGIEGELRSIYAWPNLFRFDGVVGEEFEYIAYDGTDVWYHSKAKPLEAREDDSKADLRLDHHLSRMGDWKLWHPHMEVIQQLNRGGKNLLLVRTGDTSAPARTLFVDADSGLVLGEDKVSAVEGIGRLGQRLRYADFRDVSGMQLPFALKIKYANQMLGTSTITVSEYKLGEEFSAETFNLKQ